VSPTLSGGHGTAHVTSLGIAPAALLELMPAGRLSSDIGAGASFDWLSVKGSAAAPYQGQTLRAFAVSPLVAASLGIRLSSSFGFRADGMAGYVLPVTTVSFADNAATRWGAPWVSAGIWLIWGEQ